VNSTTNSGANTWYEQGSNPSAPSTGLPSGTVVTSASNSNIRYQMPDFNSGNDALLLDGSNTGNVSTGTLTFAFPLGPGPLSFSFLTSTGNAGSGTTLTLTLNLVGGGTFAVTPTITSPDWFNSTPVAINANGRVSLGGYNNVNAGNPRLYDETVATGYTGAQGISGISISAAFNNTSGNTAIFAVSGSIDGTNYFPMALNTSSFNQSIVATPEPASFGLLGLAGLGLLARRRRA
jgi:hypothetical protein